MRQRSRRGTVEVLTAIGQLTEITSNAAEVRRELERRHPGETLPSERTIRDMIKETRPPNATVADAWSPMAADPGEVSLVMPVLQAVIETTGGQRRQFTKELAATIAQVRLVAPDLPPWNAYVLASAYTNGARHGAPLDGLDTLVTFAPWRGAAARDRYWRAVKANAPRFPIADAVRIVPDLCTGPEAPLQLKPTRPGEWIVSGSVEHPPRKRPSTRVSPRHRPTPKTTRPRAR